MKSCVLVRQLQYFLGARAHNNCVFARVCCGGERVDGMRQRCVSANPYKREEHNLAYKIGGGRSKSGGNSGNNYCCTMCLFLYEDLN